MHEYVSTMVDRNETVFWIALIAVGASIGAGVLLRSVGVDPPTYLAPPGVLTIFGFFFGLYNRWLWTLGIRGHRLSKIPDLNGSWQGTVDIRSHEGAIVAAALACTITIDQTWSRISIYFDTEFTRSTSVMASLGSKEEPHGGLRYEYDVTPKPGAEAPEGVDLNRHFGMARLQPVKSDWDRLTGEFYNDRSYQRWGVYKMEKD